MDGSQPRYKFSAGFAKSQVLFNLHHPAMATGKPTAIVREGFFDCLKEQQAGFRSVVALMGSALSERCLLVQRFHDVTLLLDSDRVGRHTSIAPAAGLRQGCPVRTVQLNQNAQPDQLSSQCLQEILAQKGASPQTRRSSIATAKLRKTSA